ncbi:hypothetical protein [Kitasatospora aureofaciens]
MRSHASHLRPVEPTHCAQSAKLAGRYARMLANTLSYMWPYRSVMVRQL